MELNVREWKEFKLSSIMNVFNGKGLTDDEIVENKGFLPAIQGGENNLGILGYINEEYCKKQNYIIIKEPCLTVARVGTAGYVSYHEKCVIGDKAKALVFKDKKLSTPFKYLFMCTILNTNRYKYSYGRGLVTEKYMNESLKLPIQYNNDCTPVIDTSRTYSDEGFIPDWQFMEDYIKSLRCKPITTKIKTNEQKDLNTDKWEEFKVSNLFNRIYKAKAHTKEDIVEVDKGIHFVSRTDCNNGVDIAVDKNAEYNGLEEANCITIGDTTATVFYQNERFIAGDHMVVLRADWLNLKRGLFFRTLFAQEGIRYCYGRAYRMDLIKDTLLKLPIKRDDNGNPILNKKFQYSSKGYIPDWQFMEDYINSLPYSDKI